MLCFLYSFQNFILKGLSPAIGSPRTHSRHSVGPCLLHRMNVLSLKKNILIEIGGEILEKISSGICTTNKCEKNNGLNVKCVRVADVPRIQNQELLKDLEKIFCFWFVYFWFFLVFKSIEFLQKTETQSFIFFFESNLSFSPFIEVHQKSGSPKTFDFKFQLPPRCKTFFLPTNGANSFYVGA